MKKIYSFKYLLEGVSIKRNKNIIEISIATLQEQIKGKPKNHFEIQIS